MGTFSREKRIFCPEDCKSSGCPGHTVRVEINTCSDLMFFQPDISESRKFAFNSVEWKTLKEILSGWGDSGFDLLTNPQP